MQRQCDKCDQPATHKIVKIVNGELREMFFCNEHAAEANSLLAQTQLQVSLEDLLNSLISQQVQQQAAETEANIKCGVCGLPFKNYRKTMILGCDRCYESFEEQLEADLRKFHGETRHRGRRPPNFQPRTDRAQAVVVADPDEAAAPAPESSIAKPAAGASKIESVGERLTRLRREMNDAVEAEDFEAAARLRDEIRDLEEKRKGE